MREPIKPIPTKFAGITFRSRLEARYAKLFSELGIDWEYEPEGFELPCGIRYLPDFYLRQIKFFAEIKPDYETFKREDKAEHFVRAGDSTVIVFDGLPALKPYAALHAFEETIETVNYSLDIHQYPKAWSERRLWSDPDQGTDLYSVKYTLAVALALTERFGC